MNAGLFSRQGDAVALKGVEVEGEVLGAHARVTVRQRYAHEGPHAIEAVYTFPLPSDATLTRFSMTCEGRRFEGAVQEREAAFRAYDDAIVAGHGAALLEQERANVFTATVGNLLPGEESVVEVEYVQRVQVDEGALRWMLPTLVAPRYIPGAAAGDRTGHGAHAPTDRVPDADRITPPRAEGIPYRLRLDVTFDLGRAVRVESPSHAIVVTAEGARVRVRLAQAEVALDRDVVLTASGAEGGLAHATAVVAHREAGAEGYLSLSLVPDLYSLGAEAARAATVVFLLDVSGSMEGDAIREARAALRLCLRHLRAGDRFNIIAFSSSHRCFSGAPLGFTEETLARADRWIEARQADGGTELLEPLTRATAMADGGVVILLTDGQVGNEDEILRAVMQRRGASRTRVCSFGIGTNVSDALLRDLARETGGAVEFIHPGERIDEKVVAQFARSVAPRITDVRVRFEGLDVGEVAPAAAPDVVDGEAWSLHARYARGGAGAVEIQGRYRGEPYALRVPLALPDEASRPVVAQLWAAERIRDLEAARVEGRRADTMKQRIVALSVAHGVASRFTSFVVVEHRTGERRATAMPETAVVPVNAPAGWAMFDASRAPAAAPAAPLGAMAPRAAPASKRKRAMPPRPAPALASLAPRDARGEATGSVSAGSTGYDTMDDDGAAVASDAFADDGIEREINTGGGSLDDESFADAMTVRRGGGAAVREESRRASKAAGAVEPLGDLFARQLASGLWDDASGGADAELRQLGATVRVLARLVGDGVDAAHTLYGAPLRKAIDAVITLARDCARRDPARSELALGAAWLLATGPRTRSALRVVIDAGPFAVVAAKRQNTDELRAWVLAATI